MQRETLTATLTLVSSRARHQARRCTQAGVVDGLDQLDAILRSSRATTLDLIGHSTRGHHHLRLGRDVVDLLDPRIAARITALVASGALDAAGVRQIRLLGCSTAVGPAARCTLARLASISGRVVSGTTRALLSCHYDAAGFRALFSSLLVDVRPAGAQPRYGAIPCHASLPRPPRPPLPPSPRRSIA